MKFRQPICGTFPGLAYQLGNFAAAYAAQQQAWLAERFRTASGTPNYALTMALVECVVFIAVIVLAATGLTWVLLKRTSPPEQGQLWRHRNLGKAFYENPTTQREAVDEFRKALALAPDSIRERINYGSARRRATAVNPN